MEFSEEERKRLERLLKIDTKHIDRLEHMAESDERMEWLMSSARRILSAVAIVVGALVLLWEQIRATIKFIARGMGL